MSAYAALETRFRRLADIGGALSVLHWDRAAMMPEGGNAVRAEQMATLRLLSHELLTDPETGRLIEAAEAREAGGLDEWQRANLREMRRGYDRATAVPPALVEALSRAIPACEMTWRRARAESDFAALAPSLGEVVELVRERAAALGERLGLDPYDALLDGYEPGLRAERIDRLFGELSDFLPGFLEQVLARQAAEEPPLVPAGPFPPPVQKALAERLMVKLGFDFNRGRLDESAHPFCGGVPDDVRLTTRYSEDDFTSALMAVLHETGHALYSAALPVGWRRQPVGRALGMVAHESQSLLIEMQASRSRAFIAHLAPIAREAFGGEGRAYDPDNLYRLYTRVERGFIRVDADEVTYPLHVILRYRLERDLIAGRLRVRDLPDAWNAGMAELLGVTPPNDRRGVLQDIHWPTGGLGYFPCYTLGALMAAQLFERVREEIPELFDRLGRGESDALFYFIRANVH